MGALHALVLDLFTAEEFRRWLRFGPDADIVSELPGESAADTAIVDKALGVLERHGRINANFFARMTTERDRKKEAIAAVATLWGSSATGRPGRGKSTPVVTGMISAATAFLLALVIGVLAPPGPGAPLLALGSFMLVWIAMKLTMVDGPANRKDVAVGGIGAFLVDRGSGNAIIVAVWAAVGGALGALTGRGCSGEDSQPRTLDELEPTGKPLAGSGTAPVTPREKHIEDNANCQGGQMGNDGRCETPPLTSENDPGLGIKPYATYVVSDCRDCEARFYSVSGSTSKLHARVFFYDCPINEQGYHYCITNFSPGRYEVDFYEDSDKRHQVIEFPVGPSVSPVAMFRVRRLSIRDFAVHPKLGEKLRRHWDDCLEIKLNISGGKPALVTSGGGSGSISAERIRKEWKHEYATFTDEYSHFFVGLKPGGYMVDFAEVDGFKEPSLKPFQLAGGDWAAYRVRVGEDGEVSFLYGAYCRYYWKFSYESLSE